YADAKVHQILDIGTGSGNIAAALANQWPAAQLTAVDISIDALETARQNFLNLNLDRRIKLIHSDLLDSLDADDKSFDIIVSNPPYILKAEFSNLQIDVRDFEPYTALIVEQPESFYGRLFRQALRYLKPTSIIYIESSPILINKVAEIANQAGFNHCHILKDFSGLDRFLIATCSDCSKSIDV
ncbi:MAG: HemK family protein methyltransferase, partial [Leptonema sp. (in: Bacteria)]|nr:HemK family protein methyltransferase [Leptonema sp. (in: bacteria)]